MREQLKNAEFDSSGNYVKYPLDGTEKCLLRAALEFARHNLPAFITAYQDGYGLGNATNTRNELEELAQLVRDVNYFLVLPFVEEIAAEEKRKQSK